MGSSIICGPAGAPASATASLTPAGLSSQMISTANDPSRPLAVCLIALLHNSVATLATSSRAGQSGNSEASQRRRAPS
jgi:hypothetical protein